MADWQHARHFRDWLKDLDEMDHQCERWLNHPPNSVIWRRLKACRHALRILRTQYGLMVEEVGTKPR
jgi:hypothetical protein